MRKEQEPRGTPRRARWPGERARRRPATSSLSLRQLSRGQRSGDGGRVGVGEGRVSRGQDRSRGEQRERWQMFIEAMGSFGLLWRRCHLRALPDCCCVTALRVERSGSAEGERVGGARMQHAFPLLPPLSSPCPLSFLILSLPPLSIGAARFVSQLWC